jgi:aromatic ring-opening dioxygenase catalytic subunit (LigB family)
MNAKQDPLPTLFIPHGGGPCFFMEWTIGPPDTWDRMAVWLRGLAHGIGAVPRAIVVISGHWEELDFTVTSGERPSLIYDYSGFPEDTYRLKYDAPGSPTVAERVRNLLVKAGIFASASPSRGFDHGVFIPLKLVYPNADVPIVQLSLKAGLDPSAHLAAGRALEPLRGEGVLLLGSGMSYHNLRKFGRGRASDEFDVWLTEAVTANDPEIRNRRLLEWERAPGAREAHPSEEHLLPLMVVAGAAARDLGSRIFQDQVMGATISAYQFGPSLPPPAA